MGKLTASQLNRASEIAGNIAVAWFTVGAISPLAVRPVTIADFAFTFIVSFILAAFFLDVSLKLAKEANYD